jgi:hypothetical protein
MNQDPTIDDFGNWLNHQLAKVENEALVQKSKLLSEATLAGAVDSSRTVLLANQIVDEHLEKGMAIVFSQLRSTSSRTGLDKDLLKNRAVTSLESFVGRLNNHVSGMGNRIGMSAKVGEEQKKRVGHVKFMVRQFEVGFYAPHLPAGITSMTDNSINIHGSVTGSAIQQGSPGAKQTVEASAQTFAEMNAAIQHGVSDADERMKILAALQELKVAMEKYQSETGGTWYGLKYKEFIEAAANHMNLIAPFIPSLTKWL